MLRLPVFITFLLALTYGGGVNAYTPPSLRPKVPSSTATGTTSTSTTTTNNNNNINFLQTFKPAAAFATAALSIVLATSEPASATSKLAAQIDLNSIPPTSIQVNIRDLPLVGDILSGTYTKVSEPIKNPSVTISSPKDKVGAIKAAATNGHLEFDVNGLLTTHLDIDAAAEEAGIARIRIASPIIPQLPYKNPAASALTLKGSNSKAAGEWFVVTNLGSGESYYYNENTGETQFQKPKL